MRRPASRSLCTASASAFGSSIAGITSLSVRFVAAIHSSGYPKRPATRADVTTLWRFVLSCPERSRPRLLAWRKRVIAVHAKEPPYLSAEPSRSQRTATLPTAVGSSSCSTVLHLATALRSRRTATLPPRQGRAPARPSCTWQQRCGRRGLRPYPPRIGSAPGRGVAGHHQSSVSEH